MNVETSLLHSLVPASPGGMVICDARDGDWPVLFVNAAMTQLTGYDADFIRGRNLRFLQGDDHDQAGLTRLRAALHDGIGCQTMVRNYRRDGSMFWNEITLQPLRNGAGQLTHFAGFHREVSATTANAALANDTRSLAGAQALLAQVRDDKLTGLLRQSYFEDLLKRDWSLAQRESRRLSLMLFDLDCYEQYQYIFGQPGADQTFRRVARVVSGYFRRASDLCGRFGETQIVTLTTGLALPQAVQAAESVLGRIRDLAIHHPRSSVSRFVTASAGVVSMVPPHDAPHSHFYEAALQTLQDARDLGRNRVVSRDVA